MNAHRLPSESLSGRLPAYSVLRPTRVSLLLVMTEKSGCSALRKEFLQADYDVYLAQSGHDALATLERIAIDVVLLHTELPDAHTGQICRYVRHHSRVPMVVITEQKNEVELVEFLSSGADVYVAMPITFAELNARLQATLRRTGHQRYLYQRDAARPILHLDARNRKIRIGGKETSLTQIEYRILNFLLLNVNMPVPKEQLLEAVWGYCEAHEVNFIEVAIWRLRHKIERNPSRPEYLITVRGTGYQLNVTPGL